MSDAPCHKSADSPFAAAEQFFTPGRFAVLLAALIFSAFPDVLLGTQTFVTRDYGFFAYPIASYFREHFWQGHLPLWNPLNNCGVPFLAQWNTMLLYPPGLIYLLLPMPWSLSFFCLAHLFSAGFGMYFLARRWTGSPFAAAVAGIIFAFNGFTLNLLMWPSHIATFSWFPWVILTTELACQKGGRKILVAGIIGALQMLAGGPETIFFTWLVALAILIADSAVNRSNSVRKFGRFIAIVVLVTCLSAAQLLPFLDLASQSQRELGYADTRWSMPLWGWANFFLPMFYGGKNATGVFFQYGQGWTSSYYIGIAAIVLACFGRPKKRDTKLWAIGLLAMLGLLLCFGDEIFIYRALRKLIPQLSVICYPVKFTMFAVFAAPLLAATGIVRLGEHISAPQTTATRKLFIAGSVCITIVLILLSIAHAFPLPGQDYLATFWNGFERIGFVIISIGSLVVLARTKKRNIQVGAAILFLLICWADIQTHVPPENPTSSPWVYQRGLARSKLAMHPQPELGKTRAMVSRFADQRFIGFVLSNPENNFLCKRLGYFANCNLLDDVPKVNGFFSLSPRPTDDLLTLIYNSTNDYPALLDFVGASQMTAPDKFFDWTARPTALPLITAGQRPVFLDDINALWALTKAEFNPREMVFLPPKAQRLITATNTSSPHIVSTKIADERIEFEVETKEPSMIVIAQSYYHWWHAYLNGNETPLFKANSAFQAIQVPAGHSNVAVAYEDRRFQIGTAISLATVALVLILAIIAQITCSKNDSAATQKTS